MLHQIKHFLTTLESLVFDTPQWKRRFLAKATECLIKNNSLYKRNRNQLPILIVLEPAKKLSILTQAHEKLGNRGVTAVYRLLWEKFFWPHMCTDVHHHVCSCHECQIQSLKRVEIPLTISKPALLFSKIYIDIMHMPEINRFKYIVAAKDDLSGTSEAKVLWSTTSIRKNHLGARVTQVWSRLPQAYPGHPGHPGHQGYPGCPQIQVIGYNTT